MGDFTKKTQGDNQHLANLTSARFLHIDGLVTTPLNTTVPRRVLGVTINTKGVAFVVRSGSRVIASFATTTPEGDYTLGVYAENGLTVEVSSGTGSATLRFAQ